MHLSPFLAILIVGSPAFLYPAIARENESVQEIMGKVAANQDRSQEMR